MNTELTCPRDGTTLTPDKNTTSQRCTKCKGEFLVDEKLFHYAWMRFQKLVTFKYLKCPTCQNNLHPCYFKRGNIELDICESCKGVWFDIKEQENLRMVVDNRDRKPIRRLPKKVDKSKKPISLQEKNRDYERVAGIGSKTSSMGVLLQILFDLPYENNRDAISTPIVTLLFITINVLVFVLAMVISGDTYFAGMPMVASEWTIMTATTSMFAHGSAMHLISNMYFFYVLGDNVEDLLGPIKFIALYFVANLVGDMYYVFWSADHATSSFIGASGAVSGIMGAYLCLFPKVEFSYRFYLFWEVEIPCWVMIPSMLALNIYCVYTSTDRIAYEAHIAGILVGIAFGLWFRLRRMLPASKET